MICLILLLGLVEHLLALGDGGGIIEVDDRTGCALDRLEGAADDVVAVTGSAPARDIVGDHVLLDEGAEDSYSVSLAAGKPTSISLKPILTSIWKNSSFPRGSWGR